MTPRTIGDALRDAAFGQGRSGFGGAGLQPGHRRSAGFWHVDERGEGRFVSHAELYADACRIAGGLRETGFGTGSHVGVAAGDTDTFLRAFFGVILAGCTVTSLPEAHVLRDKEGYANQLDSLLTGARADLLIADARTRDAFTTRARRVPVLCAEALRRSHAFHAEADLDDEVLVQLTSGSTEQSKAVVLSHRSISANVLGIGQALAVDGERDIAVSWLPLHHDMGLVGMMLAPLYTGVTSVLLHPLAFLKRPGLWLKTISKYRGTVSFSPCSGFELVTRRLRPRDLDQLDLSSWRVAGCGAEPIDPSVLDAFAEKLAPCGFRREAFTPSYGLAEHVVAAAVSPVGRELRTDIVCGDVLSTLGVAVKCARDHEFARPIVSCGVALDGHDISIVDRAGMPMPDRTVGEIVLRGLSVMRGYRTTAGLLESPHDGLLRTGDAGYLADGELYVCGRLKEIIIRNGRNYDPHDIEQSVSALEPLRGATIVAFGTTPFRAVERVVLAIEAPGNPIGLPDLVRGTLLKRHSLLVDEVLIFPRQTLPETTSGKPQRLALRERYERGELAAQALQRG